MCERETDTDLLTTLNDYKRLSFPTLGRAVRKRKTMNSTVIIISTDAQGGCDTSSRIFTEK